MLRQKCEKHSDPFEYWYGQKYLLTGGSFEMITNDIETIYPVVNGVCPIKKYFEKLDVDFVKWKRLVEKDKYRWCHRKVKIRLIPNVDPPVVYWIKWFSRTWYKFSLFVGILIIFHVFWLIYNYFRGYF